MSRTLPATVADEGMYVPRICPAGFVCSVPGVARADQPCPAGHYCLEGTATTSTACRGRQSSTRIAAAILHTDSVSRRRKAGATTVTDALHDGFREAPACWDNSTSDWRVHKR